ncbi:MAG: restriction endonuclease [Micropepsaceae bacterium]
MPVPDYQELMLPLLKAAAQSEKSVPEIEPLIGEQFFLTRQEREQILPSGRQRVLPNRLHWAKFYLTRAGLLASPRRGRFITTDAGRELLRRNPQAINNETLAEFPAFRSFLEGMNTSRQSEEAPPDMPAARPADITPEEQIEAAHVALQSALREELLQRILQNSPAFFEQIIVDLLVAMGYGGSHRNAAEQLGRSGDGGVDGVINQDRLGLDRVYVQAKRYAPDTSPIGRPAVQGFVGSLVGLGASKGVFATTSKFTREAIEFAKNLNQRVILLDGQRLTELMIEHNVGVRTHRTVDFKKLDEDFFSEED